MAVEDGDPRLVAPELFNQLTRPEQTVAIREFSDRVAQIGNRGRRQSDDEPAELVALKAIRFGVLFFVAALASPPGVLVAFGGGLLIDGSRGWWVLLGTTLSGLLFVGAIVFGAMRIRRVRAHFARSLLSHDVAAARAGSEPMLTTSPPSGDPEQFAPELYAEFFALARRNIQKAYTLAFDQRNSRFRHDPSADVAATALRAFHDGIERTRFLMAIPGTMGFGLCGTLAVVDRSDVAAVLAFGFLAYVVGWLAWGTLRKRATNAYFRGLASTEQM